MAKEDNKAQTTEIVNNQDWFLEDLVNIVNQTEISIGITLNVGGFLVSGHLIDGQKYFSGFSEEFISDIPGKENSDNFKKFFMKYSEIYSKDNIEESTKPPAYIHLENARFYNTSGNPVPRNKGVWWRGRLSEVSGFMLGILNSEVQ